MGTAGNLSIGFALDEMGKIVDRYSVAYVRDHDPALTGSSVVKKDAEGKPIALNEQEVEKLSKEGPPIRLWSPPRKKASRWRSVGSASFRWR